MSDNKDDVGWQPGLGGTEEPFWGWHPDHGVVWVFWECGCFRINQACYPAAYACSLWHKADLPKRWCRDDRPMGTAPDDPPKEWGESKEPV